MAESRTTPDREGRNLMMFLKGRDSESALEILEGNIDPNSVHSDGESGATCLLYQAVRTNHPTIVEILLQKGADPNFQDEEGDTPLFAALDTEVDESIQTMLYEHGADVNHKNNAGNTALMQIALRGIDFGHKCTDNTIFNFLSRCEDFDQLNSRDQSLIHVIPFAHASEIRGDTEYHVCLKFLKILTENGAQVNECDSTGWTPLHYACLSCCYEAVKFLVQEGADVHRKSTSEQTVLHALGRNPIGSDFSLILDYLLAKGLDINDTDMFGMGVLHYVVSSNKASKTSTEIILSHGGQANTKDKFGLTPLHLCVIPSVFIAEDHLEYDEDLKNDVSDIIDVLVQIGGEINAVDNNKLTPIHYSLRYENKVATVSTLLKRGADLSKRTKTGESAIHRATLYPDLLERVLKHIEETGVSVDFNLKDNFGSTALHWAVYYMSSECITMLLEAGADLNIANEMNLNPCDFAISSKITELFESLGIVYCRETYPLPYIIKEDDLISDFNYHEKVWSFIVDEAMEEQPHAQLECRKGEQNQLLIKVMKTSTEDSVNTTEEMEIKDEKTYLDDDSEEQEQVGQIDEEENVKEPVNSELHKKEESVHDEFVSEDTDLDVQLEEADNVSGTGCSETSTTEENNPEEEMELSESPKSSIFPESSAEDENENALECIKIDHMWCDCPALSDVECEDKCVFLLPWVSHLQCHKRSLAAYMNLVLESKQMGLFSETEENGCIANSIKNVMKTLALEVKRINPLLEFSLKLAGSWNEGTKITHPDEFDYKIILHKFNAVVQPYDADDINLRGFVRFRLKEGKISEAFSNFVDTNGFLDGRKVVRALYTSINIALLNIPASTLGQLYSTKYLKIEKGSIDHLSFRWVGASYKNLLIDVDIVPTIVPDFWNSSFLNTSKQLIHVRGPSSVVLKTPDSSSVVLKTPDSSSMVLKTPDSSSVVLKTPDSRFVKGWYNYFRLSVADQEAEIFKSLPREILKGYILVKSLLKTLHCPQIRVIEEEEYLQQRCLTTYMIKSCFLHQVEQTDEIVDVKEKQSDKLVAIEMAISMVDYLEKSIEAEQLESFFIPGVNLLANDSLTRFNNNLMFDVEVICLKKLLEIGYDQMQSQGTV